MTAQLVWRPRYLPELRRKKIYDHSLARPALRRADAHQTQGPHSYCDLVAGARDRRQHGNLQSGGRGVVEKSAGQRAGAVSAIQMAGREQLQDFQVRRLRADGRSDWLAHQYVVSAAELRAISTTAERAQ